MISILKQKIFQNCHVIEQLLNGIVFRV